MQRVTRSMTRALGAGAQGGGAGGGPQAQGVNAHAGGHAVVGGNGVGAPDAPVAGGVPLVDAAEDGGVADGAQPLVGDAAAAAVGVGGNGVGAPDAPVAGGVPQAGAAAGAINSALDLPAFLQQHLSAVATGGGSAAVAALGALAAAATEGTAPAAPGPFFLAGAWYTMMHELAAHMRKVVAAEMHEVKTASSDAGKLGAAATLAVESLRAQLAALPANEHARQLNTGSLEKLHPLLDDTGNRPGVWPAEGLTVKDIQEGDIETVKALLHAYKIASTGNDSSDRWNLAKHVGVYK